MDIFDALLDSCEEGRKSKVIYDEDRGVWVVNDPEERAKLEELERKMAELQQGITGGGGADAAGDDDEKTR